MELERIDESKGEMPADLSAHFQGEAKIQALSSPFPEGPAVFAVHFRPGGRTRPHVHPTGQLLHIAAGRGVVGTTSGRRLVEAGDVVVSMPGEWHWHGATPDSPMTHLTVQQAGPGSVDWDVDERDWGSDCG